MPKELPGRTGRKWKRSYKKMTRIREYTGRISMVYQGNINYPHGTPWNPGSQEKQRFCAAVSHLIRILKLGTGWHG